jgi:hypothetical protein
LKTSDKRPQALSEAIAQVDKDISKYQGFVRECTKHVSTLDMKYEHLLDEQKAKNEGKREHFYFNSNSRARAHG